MSKNFATMFQEFIIKHHAGEKIYRSAIDQHVLIKFWEDAVKKKNVTTLEHLFYLCVDILRLGLRENWLDREQPRSIVLDASRVVKNTSTTYKLLFEGPSIGSLNDTVAVVAGEAMPDSHFTEEYQLIRGPKSTGNGGFSLKEWAFYYGIPIRVASTSRLYGEGENYYYRSSIAPLELSIQEMQTFARRLWEAYKYTLLI